MSVYKLVIAILSLFSITLLGLAALVKSESEVFRLIGFYDYGLCAIFFYDFIRQFKEAKNKARYFFTFGWLDLLSSVPMVEALRIARFFRIFRVIRVIKSLRLLLTFLRSHKKSSLYGLVILLISLSVITSSVIVLYLEQHVGNIKTAEDAIWWTFVSITTVGYGDHYPVTDWGKLFSVILIFNGLIAFGTIITYMNEKIQSIKDDEGPKQGLNEVNDEF